MTDPSPPPPPGYASMPNPPPSAMWMPVDPAHQPRGIPFDMMASIALMVGFALIFVGTIIIVGWGSIPGSCVTTTPTCSLSDVRSGAANAFWAGHLLWVIGLAGIGTGAGIRLHWGSKVVRGSASEEYVYMASERKRYTLLFVVSLVLLAVVMLTVNVGPSPFIVP